MKAYIITEDFKYGHQDWYSQTKGTVYVYSDFHHSWVQCATPTKRHDLYPGLGHLFNDWVTQGKAKVAEVKDLKWLHPHLIKEHKVLLEQESKQPA